jgi:hypothetical protein
MKTATKHLGTDCAHMGDARKKQPKQGICFKCRFPLHVYTMPGNRPLEPLALLLDNRKGLEGMLLPDPWPRFRVEGSR